MIFKFNVCGDKLKFLNEREAYSGNTNYRCNFLLSDEWDGLKCFAVFIADGKAEKRLIVNGECKIPEGVLEHGEFTVGAFATNGSAEELIRISTNLIHIEVYEGAFREAGIAEEDEPTIWEQYVQLCAAEREAATDAREGAETAKSDAEGFAQEAKEAKEGIGNIAEDVEKARAETLTYRNEAFTSRGMAAISAGDAERYKNAAANEKVAAMEAKELAKEAQSMAETAQFGAESARNAAEDARDLAELYKNEAFTNKETAKSYSNTAQEEALKAEQAKQDILDVGESFVSKDKNEEISGVKTFTSDIKINDDFAGFISFSETEPKDKKIAAWVKRCIIGEREIADVEISGEVGENGYAALSSITLKLLEGDPTSFEELIIDPVVGNESFLLPKGSDNAERKLYAPSDGLTATSEFVTNYTYDALQNRVTFTLFEYDFSRTEVEKLPTKEDFIGKMAHFGALPDGEYEYNVQMRLLLRNYNLGKSDKVSTKGKWILVSSPEEINSYITSLINAHNKSSAAHSDIRKMISEIKVPEIDESNLVHKTEVEEIHGFKMFHNGIHTPSISYDGPLKIYNSYSVELNLTEKGVFVGSKEVAIKDDITTAIQEAVLDSWSEVIEP